MNTDLSALLAQRLPAFSHDKLEPFSRATLADTLSEGTYAQNTSIDLAQVRGVEHPDYQGCTWIELLGNPPGSSSAVLKRVRSTLIDLQRNPAYYLEHEQKAHWSFYQVGNDLFAAEGVHRTVVARFLLAANGLPTVIHGVGLTALHPVQIASPTENRKGWLSRLFGAQ